MLIIDIGEIPTPHTAHLHSLGIPCMKREKTGVWISRRRMLFLHIVDHFDVYFFVSIIRRLLKIGCCPSTQISLHQRGFHNWVVEVHILRATLQINNTRHIYANIFIYIKNSIFSIIKIAILEHHLQ